MSYADDADSANRARRYAERAAGKRDAFARGVNRYKLRGADAQCNGCRKWIRSGELFDITPLGTLCSECAAGIR
jgi:hypothetical protein